jgi:2-C-methyl-D-erythritol 4-phosphate cytidylyltransferase
MPRRAAQITQAEIARIIRAARREGLRIAGIKLDGTIVVYEQGDNPLASIDRQGASTEDADALRRWGDGDG